MNQLLKYREQLHLTQQQLSEKANVSVRTIQRIEAGQPLKGHTLTALATALEVTTDELLGKVPESKEEKKTENRLLIKLINLSSLPFIWLPLASIIVPLIIMYWKREINSTTKQIITLQIIWTIAFPIIVLLVIFLRNLFQYSNQAIPFTMLALLLLNVYVILKNTASLDKKGELSIFLKFSIL